MSQWLKAFELFLARGGPVSEVLLVSLLWLIVFNVNEWLFSPLEVTRHVNWIFIPAGVRVLAVMSFGWRGVIGLFAGALITSIQTSHELSAQALTLALTSSLGCLLGVAFANRILRNVLKWHELDLLQTYVFVASCAVISAGLHCLYFSYQGRLDEFLDLLIPMFMGDLIGSFVLIYGFARPIYRKLSASRAG